MYLVTSPTDYIVALTECDPKGCAGRNRPTVGYARVSTEEKHQQTSIDRQIDVLKSLCQIIVIEKESGRDANRLLYQAVINNIELISKIVATRGDRIARNHSEMIYFYYLCEDKNVQWIFTDEPELNSGSLFSIQQRSQKAFYAELESINISNRVKKAYLNAEKNLVAPNRRPPFGYRIVNGKFEIDYLLADHSNCVGYLNQKPLAKGELAKILIELFLKYQTQYLAVKHYKQDIINKLNPIVNQKIVNKELIRNNNGGIKKWLTNEILQGHTIYGKTKEIRYGEKLDKTRWIDAPKAEHRIYINTHEALISPAVAKQIHQILKTNLNYGFAVNANKHSNTPLSFSPILICNKCGSSYSSCKNKYQKINEEIVYYRHYNCSKKYDVNCPQKGISERKLREKLIVFVISKAEKLAQILIDADTGIITPDEEKYNLLIAESESSYIKYKTTGLEIYLEAYRSFKQEIVRIESILHQKKDNSQDSQKLILALSNPQFWAEMNNFDLHRYLREIVSACWLEDKAIARLELNL